MYRRLGKGDVQIKSFKCRTEYIFWTAWNMAGFRLQTSEYRQWTYFSRATTAYLKRISLCVAYHSIFLSCYKRLYTSAIWRIIVPLNTNYTTYNFNKSQVIFPVSVDASVTYCTVYRHETNNRVRKSIKLVS